MDEEICYVLYDGFAYDDDAVECIVYLADNMKNGKPYRDWLIEHDRCPQCGSKELQTIYINEVHSELGERPIEMVSDGVMCGECGEVIE